MLSFSLNFIFLLNILRIRYFNLRQDTNNEAFLNMGSYLSFWALEELTRDIRVSDTFNFSEGKRRRHQKDDRSEQGSTTGNRDKEERTYVAKNKEKVEERQPYRPREYDR